MMTLFDPFRHEALTTHAWNADQVSEKIIRILQDTDRAFRPNSFWPPHPAETDAPQTAPMACLFNGASSVTWSLLFFQKKGVFTSDQNDYIEQLENIYQSYLRSPDSRGAVVPGYLFGETGLLAVMQKLKPQASYLERLFECIQQGMHRPENELMWGTPGTLLASILLFQQCQDSRFRKLIQDSALHLIHQWDFDSHLGCHLWTQDLYGSKRQFLGGVHGFAGNVLPLLKALPFLDSDLQKQILEKSAHSFLQTAKSENGKTNWPPVPDDEDFLVQWCHGAVGMITSFADYPIDPTSKLDQHLLSGGELIWQAGPLSKPFGLCHGTAGNGYAFLKLYNRCGDEKWLQRARAFAMHALQQSDKNFQKYGRHRYELFTGDLGLAQYLWSCLNKESQFPLIDFI